MNIKEVVYDGNLLELKRFDMRNLAYDKNREAKNPRIAVIAKSGSGKSWVVRDILYYLALNLDFSPNFKFDINQTYPLKINSNYSPITLPSNE